jgi:hypothetical protein
MPHVTENRRRRRQEHRKRNQSTWEHSNPAVDSENEIEGYVERVPFELSAVPDGRLTQEHIDQVADTSLSDKTADTLSEENNCTSMPSIGNDAETNTTSADGNANTEVGQTGNVEPMTNKPRYDLRPREPISYKI